MPKGIKHATGTYVAGWRDQECPLCEAKWFVNASTHVTKFHGVRIPGLSSEAFRVNHIILLTEANRFSYDMAAIRRRHLRWAATITEEQALGGAYIKRLARRWKVPYWAADGRVHMMKQRGLIVRKHTPRDPRRSIADQEFNYCQRGHPMTDDNLYFGSGGRGCLTCRRKYDRERKAKRYRDLHEKK